MTTVHFRVDNDDDARRVAALLDALGYVAVRQLDDAGEQRLHNALARLVKRHKLTKRETDVLDRCIVQGMRSTQASEELDISRATIKWHMANVFAKTGTSSREDLLRLLLKR